MLLSDQVRQILGWDGLGRADPALNVGCLEN